MKSVTDMVSFKIVVFVSAKLHSHILKCGISMQCLLLVVLCYYSIIILWLTLVVCVCICPYICSTLIPTQ